MEGSPATHHSRLGAVPREGERVTPLELFFDLNRHRLGLAIVLLFLVPVATAVPALISLAAAVALIWTMIVFEHRRYGPGRDQLRREANAARS